jgi:serine O-acetyltransferase
MKQSFKQTLTLINADIRLRCEIEEKPMTFFRKCRYMIKSAVAPVLLYRWQVFFYQHHMGLLASFLKTLNNIVFTVKIDSEAQIGPGLIIYHSSYVLIGRNVQIGQNCQLANQNTIMASSFYDGETKNTVKGPVIGDNLLLGCGASIVGNVVLGDNIKVSMNSTVDQSFPDNAILIGVPARNVAKSDVIQIEGCA